MTPGLFILGVAVMGATVGWIVGWSRGYRDGLDDRAGWFE